MTRKRWSTPTRAPVEGAAAEKGKKPTTPATPTAYPPPVGSAFSTRPWTTLPMERSAEEEVASEEEEEGEACCPLVVARILSAPAAASTASHAAALACAGLGLGSADRLASP